jgi:hypothetical protein
MFARAALLRTPIVTGVVLLGGTLALGLACGASSHVSVDATAISAGNEHTCALLSIHTIKCWGFNGTGELGDGVSDHAHKGTLGEDISPIPVQVRRISNATQLSAAGSMYTCAVLSRGTVECWGNNSYGQLGNGTSKSSSTPLRVSGITNATQVSARTTLLARFSPAARSGAGAPTASASLATVSPTTATKTGPEWTSAQPRCRSAVSRTPRS